MLQEKAMRKDELEWQLRQYERICQSVPHLLREMTSLTQKMRTHFQDDPSSLKHWDDHSEAVLNGFAYRLPKLIASPGNLSVSLPCFAFLS